MHPIFLILFFTFYLASVQAQQQIALYEGTPPNSKTVPGLADTSVFFPAGKITIEFMTRVAAPNLAAYFPKNRKKHGSAAVIICPGGGYTGLAIGHEGRDIAERLQAAGIAAFVLKYRLPNPYLVENKEVVPLQDAQRAIQLVRENAKIWGIDPLKIGILGSSAGGHLASTAGTHWQTPHISNPKNTSLRPDFMILNYPVISFADSLTHFGSRFNLSGPVLQKEEFEKIMADWETSEMAWKKIKIPADALKKYSNELQVRADTPPVFITAAVDDDVVKVQNSLVFIAALQKNHVPFGSFFYANGGHGYGMDNPTSEVDWMDSCLDWLKKEGFLKK